MKKQNLVWLFSLLIIVSACFVSCNKDDDGDDNKVNADAIYAMWQPVSVEGYYILEGEKQKNNVTLTGSSVYDGLSFTLYGVSGKVSYYDGSDPQKLVFDFDETFSLNGTTLKCGSDTYKVVKLDSDNLVLEENINDGTYTVGDKKCSDYYAKATFKKCSNYKTLSK
jgi:hypothetical protein